ncbi:hypothetical protein RvY_08798 [Ramazzottius varieornatus]|uniref:MABP domain-containing protein n=1 Tax=Ramazzottius varieornatus TaxID=947166 RepID=A0A1D1V765_RAMVA|nr:hypothetical protein RvY_08798 [Ramazzottius varieornatus]
MEDLQKFDPITGLCIVAKKLQCPIGYRCLDKSYDQSADADLWKDSIFGTKNERYMCLTRFYPLENGRLNNVLQNIVLLNEKDPVPAGCSVVDLTEDTKEKALRKKQLVVRMVPRFSVTEAICDLIILSRKRTPPEGYTFFGDVGGLLLCFLRGPIPPDSTKSPSPSIGSAYILQQHDVRGTDRLRRRSILDSFDTPTDRPSAAEEKKTINAQAPQRSSMITQTGASLARQASRAMKIREIELPGGSAAMDRGVEDVPFRVNLSPGSQDRRRDHSAVPLIPYRTWEEMQHELDYDFELEKKYLESR